MINFLDNSLQDVTADARVWEGKLGTRFPTGIYRYSALSVLEPNGETVLESATNVGRWILALRNADEVEGATLGTIGQDGVKRWLTPYTETEAVLTVGGSVTQCGNSGVFTLFATGRNQVVPGTTSYSRVRFLGSTTATPNLTSIKLVVGEKLASGNLEVIYTSEELISQWPAGPTTEVAELSFAPVTLPVGAVAGIRVEGPVSGLAGSVWTKIFAGASSGRIEYFAGNPADPADVVTTKAATHGWYLNLYGTSPAMVAHGDSNMVGQFGAAASVPGDTVAAQVEAAFGMGCCNGGVGGATTAQILARLVAGVNVRGAQWARLVRVNGGVNDLYQGTVTQAQFIANWTQILDLLQAPRQYVIVDAIYPWSLPNGTNERMATRDTWNTALEALVESYPNALFVNYDSVLGQNRPTGTPGNLWDIKTAYVYATDGLGVHFNAAGYLAREQHAASLAEPWLLGLGVTMTDEEIPSSAVLAVLAEAPLRASSGTSSPIISIDAASDDTPGYLSATAYSKVSRASDGQAVGRPLRWLTPYAASDDIVLAGGTATQVGDIGIITLLASNASKLVPASTYYSKCRILCHTISSPKLSSIRFVCYETLADGQLKQLHRSVNLIDQWPDDPATVAVELTFPRVFLTAGAMVGVMVSGPVPGTSSAWTKIFPGEGMMKYFWGDPADPSDVTPTLIDDHGWMIHLAGEAPPMALLGDALMLGPTGDNTEVPAESCAAITEAAFGLGCLAGGLPGGATVATVLAHVTPLGSSRGVQFARLLRLNGGVNDIVAGTSQANFLFRWSVILNYLQGYRQYVIVDGIYPWTNGTNVRMATRDTWNAALEALCATYTNVLYINHDAVLGQFRVGGAVDNLWDIKAEYLHADGLGVFLNPAGVAAREANAASLTETWLATKGLTLASFINAYEPEVGSAVSRLIASTGVAVTLNATTPVVATVPASASVPGHMTAAQFTKLEGLMPLTVLRGAVSYSGSAWAATGSFSGPVWSAGFCTVTHATVAAGTVRMVTGNTTVQPRIDEAASTATSTVIGWYEVNDLVLTESAALKASVILCSLP